MRTILTQGHSQNLRDLILNYQLDKPFEKVIDFTYGTGSIWKSEYSYRFTLVKCDAVPTSEDVTQKDLTQDDYGDLEGPFIAGIADFPYLYGHQAFDYSLKPMALQGKNSWNNKGELDRFTANKSIDVFIDRVKGLNRVAYRILRDDGLLFVKVMDSRFKGKLVLNHLYFIEYLTSFQCHAIFIYYAGGAKTWKSHAETSHGYWMVFKKNPNTRLN